MVDRQVSGHLNALEFKRLDMLTIILVRHAS